MNRTILGAGAIGLLSIGLAGCDSKSGSTTTVTPPVTTAFEDQFGMQFGVAYRVAANTDPANVNDTDVVALSLTTEPISVP